MAASLTGAAAAFALIVQLAGLGSLRAGLSDLGSLGETYGTLPGCLALLQANSFLAAAFCAGCRSISSSPVRTGAPWSPNWCSSWW